MVMRTLGVLAWVACAGSLAAADAPWKAGLAKAAITPQAPMWMGGYAGRTGPAQGTFHDLWVRVLALEDSSGRRAVVVSTDTLGVSRIAYENITSQLKSRLGLEPAQVMLNASHTHSGPVVEQTLFDAYPLDTAELERIRNYTRFLESTVAETVEKAISNLAPARLSIGAGHATFAVNRRNNPEGEVPALREKGRLRGPFDHAVPVLAVRDENDALVGVVFAYACHNTTLDFYQWCGDYAGFAEEALEADHPGCTAMFVMGCGGDQNPLPRRTVELAQDYGRQLAGAVDRVLAGPMTDLTPTLSTQIDVIELRLGDQPTREELERIAAGEKNYHQRWAARLLGELDSGRTWPTTYPYPLQVWTLGELTWIAMAGEVVVDYAIKFKSGRPNVWVTAYANDVMAYIPSFRVLKEGGYEGQSSMIGYGMPAHRWADDVEDRITESAARMLERRP